MPSLELNWGRERGALERGLAFGKRQCCCDHLRRRQEKRQIESEKRQFLKMAQIIEREWRWFRAEKCPFRVTHLGSRMRHSLHHSSSIHSLVSLGFVASLSPPSLKASTLPPWVTLPSLIVVVTCLTILLCRPCQCCNL